VKELSHVVVNLVVKRYRNCFRRYQTVESLAEIPVYPGFAVGRVW